MVTEKRLIDAAKAVIKISGKVTPILQKHGSKPRGIYLAVLEALAECPTVDAVEVVHGRWETTLVPDGYVQKASRTRKKCSVCGWTNACRYNYCPNCGAKMDGVADKC